MGPHLFSQIDGDFFDILGLPLLPVLEFLRNEDVVMT
jgi:septum formation protein